MFTYRQQMKMWREALGVLSEKLPDLQSVVEEMATRKQDRDLKIMTLPDLEYKIMERECEEIEKKVYRFDPEDQYGRVETLSAEEKRGYHG
jgi:hypothetical protein